MKLKSKGKLVTTGVNIQFLYDLAKDGDVIWFWEGKYRGRFDHENGVIIEDMAGDFFLNGDVQVSRSELMHGFFKFNQYGVLAMSSEGVSLIVKKNRKPLFKEEKPKKIQPVENSVCPQKLKQLPTFSQLSLVGRKGEKSLQPVFEEKNDRSGILDDDDFFASFEFTSQERKAL